MDYPLDKLHKVRVLREELAQSDLAAGRSRLHQAGQELSSKRTHLEGHRLHKSKMQIRLFDELESRAVTLNEFETYCDQISDLCAKEKKYQEKVHQAEIRNDSARQDVDRLRDVLQKRCRESAKLKEFRNTRNVKIEEDNSLWMEEEIEEMVTNQFVYNHTIR